MSHSFLKVENVRPWTHKEVIMIQTLIENFRQELKIKGNICLVDAEQWMGIMHPSGTKKEKEIARCELFYYAGYSQHELRIIYLNPRRCTSPQEVNNIVYHEMLHLKHPQWSEKKVFDTANKRFPLMFGQTFKID